jgi:hypothetical protein
LERAEGGDARKSLASISTLGDASLLLGVLNGEVATGGKNLTNTVGLGVVGLAATISNSLDHL